MEMVTQTPRGCRALALKLARVHRTRPPWDESDEAHTASDGKAKSGLESTGSLISGRDDQRHPLGALPRKLIAEPRERLRRVALPAHDGHGVDGFELRPLPATDACCDVNHRLPCEKAEDAPSPIDSVAEPARESARQRAVEVEPDLLSLVVRDE